MSKIKFGVPAPNIERLIMLVCSFEKHDMSESREILQQETDNCSDCVEARNKRREHIQNTCTIDPQQPYGQHISLTCKNHPDLFWNTKNIDFIGARHIFFNHLPPIEECDCPLSDLIVAKVEQ